MLMVIRWKHLTGIWNKYVAMIICVSYNGTVRMAQWRFVQTALRNLALYTYTGCVFVSLHNFVWNLVSDLYLQHLLMVCLSLGQLFVFFIILYKSWNITHIHIFKLKYIVTTPTLLENCSLLLIMIPLTSLAIKKMKILFCNIVVKHSKLGLQGYDAGPSGERNVVHWSMRSRGLR